MILESLGQLSMSMAAASSRPIALIRAVQKEELIIISYTRRYAILKVILYYIIPLVWWQTLLDGNEGGQFPSQN